MHESVDADDVKIKNIKIRISHSTLKLRLKEFNLRRRGVAFNEVIVRQRISQLLDGPGCYRSVWHT